MMRRGLLASLAVILALSGCVGRSDVGPGASKEVPSVRLNNLSPLDTSNPSQKGPEPPLRLGVASIVSPAKAVQVHLELVRYLEQRLGRPVELVQRRTYAETYELLRAGSLEVASVCTYVYILGHQEFGLDLLVAPEAAGATTYQSFIIVRKSSGMTEFADLRSKRFAFTDPLSATGRLYPLLLLQDRRTTPEEYFSSNIYTYSHDNSIEAVVGGVVDAAAVDSLVYHHWLKTHPDEGESLTVLLASPVYGSPPFVVSPTMAPALRKQLREIFLSMHEDAEGLRILEGLGVERFQLLPDSAYDGVRELAEKVVGAP